MVCPLLSSTCCIQTKVEKRKSQSGSFAQKSLLSAIFSPWCLILWTLEIFKVCWSVSACCECRYWCNGSGSWSPLSCVKNYRFWERGAELSWGDIIQAAVHSSEAQFSHSVLLLVVMMMKEGREGCVGWGGVQGKAGMSSTLSHTRVSSTITINRKENDKRF